MSPIPTDDLAAAMRRAYPELETVREAAADPVFLVGGAVRDLLLGQTRSDIDLVVEGDARALADRLGAEVVEHERFATAKVELDGHDVDIASARTETYSHPGALPKVEPAASIEADLGRRDFTINAMAVTLGGEARLVDPHGGHADLENGLLRIMHRESFADDPTRALRAARYAARLDLALERETERLLRATDLETVSADRREAELQRLAAEPGAARGFALLAEWGLADLREDGADLAARVAELLSAPPWKGFAPRGPTVLRAALGPTGGEGGLAVAEPDRPSLGFELAADRDPSELALARAMGGEWLDRHLLEWRGVELEIDGEDLIEAGVAEGPAVGRGLREALRGKLDGEISGREEELAAALAAAREA
jgi:tRNA nucleotidyltransferase (CCA-adding enzyme)